MCSYVKLVLDSGEAPSPAEEADGLRRRKNSGALGKYWLSVGYWLLRTSIILAASASTQHSPRT